MEQTRVDNYYTSVLIATAYLLASFVQVDDFHLRPLVHDQIESGADSDAAPCVVSCW
jgi:hypothetical protein